jgi:hypothetical protein
LLTRNLTPDQGDNLDHVSEALKVAGIERHQLAQSMLKHCRHQMSAKAARAVACSAADDRLA